MYNSPNREVNYHIFENKGNYPVITIYDEYHNEDTNDDSDNDENNHMRDQPVARDIEGV